jgi:hypothetical protein
MVPRHVCSFYTGRLYTMLATGVVVNIDGA